MTAQNIDEINRQLEEQFNVSQQLQEQINMLESIAKKHMSKEAISRYGNIKVAHPETAIKAVALIAQAIQIGQFKEKINDKDFKDILRQIQEKKEFRFKNH